jgi:uncharacterized membrane protein
MPVNDAPLAACIGASPWRQAGMTFALFLASPPTIQAHAFFVIFAIVLGAIQFALQKAVLWSQSVGWTFTFVMMLAAGTSFFIHAVNACGPWSPIRLLSILTLSTAPLAVGRAHQGDVVRHPAGMILIDTLALIVAAVFKLCPRRIVHRILFGG